MDSLTIAPVAADPMDAARAALAADPDGVVETIAAKAGVSPRIVLEQLPPAAAVIVGPERFADIWDDMTGWGEVLFIVHTGDIVLECAGVLPSGSESRGWFNIHGDSPIGGHIRKDNCTGIAVVDRMFHGRRSCSIWFLNGAGEAMFKVFVRRDALRELLKPQVEKFEALRAWLSK